MTSRRLVPAVIAITTILLLLVTASPSLATPSLSARARKIQRQLDALYMRMDVVTDQYNSANDRLTKVRGAIRENEHNIAIARYNLAVAKDTLHDRIVAMYKERPVDLLDVILQTRSFDDMLTQLDLLQKLGASDAKVVSSIKTWEPDIAKRRVALNEQRTTAAKLVSEVAAKRALIHADITRASGCCAASRPRSPATRRRRPRRRGREPSRRETPRFRLAAYSSTTPAPVTPG